jgi:hypothetical protein
MLRGHRAKLTLHAFEVQSIKGTLAHSPGTYGTPDRVQVTIKAGPSPRSNEDSDAMSIERARDRATQAGHLRRYRAAGVFCSHGQPLI